MNLGIRGVVFVIVHSFLAILEIQLRQVQDPPDGIG